MTTAQNLVAVTFLVGLLSTPAAATVTLPADRMSPDQVREECNEHGGTYVEEEGNYHCNYPNGSVLQCDNVGEGCYFLLEDRVAPPTGGKTGVAPKKAPGAGTVLK